MTCRTRRLIPPFNLNQTHTMKARPAKKSGQVVLELNRRDEPLMKAAGASASPFSIKRILVPIDFSDGSKKALRYALPFAREHGAAITLLYVVAPAYGAGEYGSVDFAQLEAGLKRSGEKELTRLAAELAGKVPADTLVRVGSAASTIARVAADLNADMIIIATQGRTGLKHVLLGSVAENVVRRAPCPVLVVREREHEFIAN
jgi:universal stress protein A